MTDTPAPDYKDTVFLPKTDFPMKAGLASKEPAILARWDRLGLYDRLREQRQGRTRFILHDGPPYANGDIHMGHAMNKVLKDIIVRSQSLMGKDAPYVPGWDCHGLPIEWKVEEAYRAKKQDKDQVPVAQFRAECRAYAEKWVAVQRPQFERLGVMGDWSNPYLTMKYEAEAAIVGELLKFAESGQLYRGAKPVMWSPVEKTALAEAEVEYEDVVSTQIDVAFEIVEAPNAPELVGAHAVIWTTTPWTIPVNQALAYGPEIRYVLGELEGKTYLFADDLIEKVYQRIGPVRLTGFGLPGSKLEGAVARHPMHALGGFFAKPRPILPGDFVTTDAGTGLVHMAPDHGEDDFLLCKQYDIDPVFAVDGAGMYRADWAWLGGQGSVINKKFVSADGPICTDLRAAGALLAASDDFSHSYPHSWRSKAKVIFRATPQWFIPMDAASTPSPLRGEGRGEGEASQRSAPADTAPLPGPLPASGEREQEGNAATLREVALDAIARTRWVPARSENRITAMVSQRPDWVISRQRAWGVPIALYVHRATGQYLNDAHVNARIVAAFRAGGADAWFAADHQALLGDAYRADDYEIVTDILDVWFDSGSTHAFVIEARYGEGVRADLYVEGSDQHRGWFQSSLLESSGTRGRAPYDAVLTHGFALDGHGKKMSKSLGNVVDPLRIIADSGADILRMWVASVDYFEDVRIGKEVLATTSDGYRKLRNTFRYLLGALDGFDEAERVAAADMPELERYMLHRLHLLDGGLRSAADDYAFNRYLRLLTDFASEDLSAFYFDIRKDSLYCDAPTAIRRRACRTVLDTLFHALVRYTAPILVFTTEEAWQARFPSEHGSVHFLEWPRLEVNEESKPSDAGGRYMGYCQAIDELRIVRKYVNAELECMRRNKDIGSSLDAKLLLSVGTPDGIYDAFKRLPLAELFIVSEVELFMFHKPFTGTYANDTIIRAPFKLEVSDNSKCGRCWRLLPEVVEDGALCGRCSAVVA